MPFILFVNYSCPYCHFRSVFKKRLKVFKYVSPVAKTVKMINVRINGKGMSPLTLLFSSFLPHKYIFHFSFWFSLLSPTCFRWAASVVVPKLRTFTSYFPFLSVCFFSTYGRAYLLSSTKSAVSAAITHIFLLLFFRIADYMLSSVLCIYICGSSICMREQDSTKKFDLEEKSKRKQTNVCFDGVVAVYGRLEREKAPLQCNCHFNRIFEGVSIKVVSITCPMVLYLTWCRKWEVTYRNKHSFDGELLIFDYMYLLIWW